MWIWIICGIMLQTCFVITENRKRYLEALLLKGAAACCFVILGWQCHVPGMAYCSWIVAGLFFGMMGDVILNLRYLIPAKADKIFLVGIVAFLLGHVWYLVALLKVAEGALWIPAIVGIVMAAVFLKIIFAVCDVKIAFKIFGIFYVGAICLMTVFGIWVWVHNPETAHLLFAVGGVAFLISDLVLIFNTFRGESKLIFRIVNLSTYYLGQLLIAGSMYFLTR